MKCDRKDPKTQRTLTMVTVLLVILAGTLSSYFRNGGEAEEYLSFHNEGYLTIKDEAGNAEDVSYTDITFIQYVQSPDYGEPDGGSTVDDVRLGIWRSEQFGSYLNCTRTDLEACIFLRTGDEAYVINCQSDDTTQALYEAILRAREQLTS